MKRLSVLLTNFNHASFLKERIPSILGQLGEEDELVIVDDASKDESASVLASFAKEDARIRFFQNPHNRGPAKTANLAVKEAKGTYVCWLASDDILLPGFVEETLRLLKQHPTVGVACSNYAFCYEDSPTVYSCSLIEGADKPLVISPEESAPFFRKTLFWIPGHTAIMKRDLVLQLGLFQDVLGPYCDWFLIHAIAFLSGVIYIPRDYAVMRKMPASYSTKIGKNKAKTKAYQDALLRHLETLPNKELIAQFKKSGILRSILRPHFLRFTFFPKYWDQLFLFYFLGCKSKWRNFRKKYFRDRLKRAL